MNNDRTDKIRTDKIKTEEGLMHILDGLRRSGKRVVFTNGCFDILHAGHVRYLNEAKKLGDVLVVGINTDSSVKRFKGEKRPINPEDQRAEVVAALESVDFIVLFNDRYPSRIISLLKPDVHVKAGDYTPDQMPEAGVVESYGGKVVIVELVNGISTTRIIRKIIEAYGADSDENKA